MNLGYWKQENDDQSFVSIKTNFQIQRAHSVLNMQEFWQHCFHEPFLKNLLENELGTTTNESRDVKNKK